MVTFQTNIIDFHMHAFPDKIAQRTIATLQEISQTTPVTDGTIEQTILQLKRCHITAGVIMPIATKPAQQTNINNWAAQIQQQYSNLYCFGSVHPDAPNAIEELYRIKELHLKGVKLHPDYQHFNISEPRLFPIYETISKLGLPVLFHTGKDPVSPYHIHAPAVETAKVCDHFPDMIIIAAHLGGLMDYEQAEQHLVGKNLYLDTSMAKYCSPEQLKRIILNHGANHILFATDCPWGNGLEDISRLKALNLSKSDLDAIFYQNALQLLG